MARRIKEDVFRGILEFLYYFYAGAVLILTARINLGKNIFEMDWDLLIILDACRVDAMIQIAPEYDFIQNVDVATSVGSSSDEWLAKTFNKKHADKIAKTSYITANPNFSMVIDERLAPPIHAPVPFRPSLNYYGTVSMDDFAHFDEVYKDSRGRREKVVLPSTLVERAIDAGRRSVAQKYVIHFMQPHVPYIGVPNPPSDPFQLYKNDNLSHSEIWDMYLDTLRLVLDEVQKLLNNFDAERVIITADHGEAFGEWNLYSHTICSPQPVVKNVPIVTTKSKDNREYIPQINKKSTTEWNPDEQLRDLGYL